MISDFSSLTTDLQKHVHLWLKTKNDLVKHSSIDDLSEIRLRYGLYKKENKVDQDSKMSD